MLGSQLVSTQHSCSSDTKNTVLAQAEQDGLGIDEQTPARQAEQQQDDDAPLKDHSHPQQVLATKCLHNSTESVFISVEHVFNVSILTRGPAILRMWYSSSRYASGILLRTHLQQKSLSLDPSMSAGPGNPAGFSSAASAMSPIFDALQGKTSPLLYFNTAKEYLITLEAGQRRALHPTRSTAAASPAYKDKDPATIACIDSQQV
ncbi:hypothetical protein EYF80_023705 [Liparis tanakae]|uniref:Uncharacterized protein n=1 Tax=Liparis tanakae TaxID=230148 RepID=A0A4Z2HJX1_9TELE|nr:hypothetical protein EYF80_023705 [Liparis tanakae]